MNFNLITDPWIPVRFHDGGPGLLGLADTFGRATEIADLSVPVHERISIMRLLVCITQAALGAPDEPDDWDGWGANLAEEAVAYLDKWREHFDLFGDGPRFLQTRFDDQKDYPSAQIAFQLSTGNTPTFLDHTGDGPREFGAAFLARTLLAYQNHFVGGSLASKVKGNGPALKALHSLLIGSNLRDTIVLNCVDRETLGPLPLGTPIWEGGGPTEYLGRLVPAPCRIWFVDGGRRSRIDQGSIHPEFEDSGIREPSTTVITGKRNGAETPVLLRASVGRGIWRDLHCITVIGKNQQRAPLTFTSHFIDRHGTSVRFWAGELIKAKDAKILDAVESSFTVPWALFKAAGRQRYQAGVQFAEFMESRLRAGVFIYGKTLKHDKLPTEVARQHYWHTLDQRASLLLDLLEAAGTENDPMGAASFGKGADPWTRQVRQAARDAYAATCPCATPRQHKAFTAGLKQLGNRQTKSTDKATAKP